MTALEIKALQYVRELVSQMNAPMPTSSPGLGDKALEEQRHEQQQEEWRLYRQLRDDVCDWMTAILNDEYPNGNSTKV